MSMKGLDPLTRVPDLSGYMTIGQDYVTPQMFAPAGSIIGDGTARALSTIYSTLGDAQVVFPFITALTQTLDYACIKSMSNEALGPDQTAVSIPYTDQPTSGSTASLINDTTQSWTVNEHTGKTLYFRYANGFIGTAFIASNTATALTLSPALPYGGFMIGGSACGYLALGDPENIYDCVAYGIGSPGEHGDANALLNKPMFIPGGTYMLEDDTWLIRNASGIRIIGGGRRATKVTSNTWAFATDGLWYSRIEGIEFDTLDGTAGHGAVDLDGNVPGHPYTTRSVQQNTFAECHFGGGGSTYALAVCRQGGSSAQGECLYENCTWANATVTYYQNGFNALANLILRGDMQDYTTGVYISAGDIHVVSTSMESGKGYAQITDTSFVAHGGFDFDCSASGVDEPITIEGVRSESLRFFRGSASQTGVLIGNQTSHGTDAGWTASVAGYYTVGKSIVKNSVSLGPKLYVVTTAGTSGSSEPTWPDSGTVTDGSVVWTMTDFFVVDASQAGRLVLIENHFTVGKKLYGSVLGLPLGMSLGREVVGNFTATHDDELLLVDATGGNRTITLPINHSPPSSVQPPTGKRYIIKKYDTSANTVTVQDDAGSGPDGAAYVIPGGSRGFVTVELYGGGALTMRYWIIGKG